MINNPTVFDLFSGCGGLSHGLSIAGMKVCWANENWTSELKTYRSYHGQTTLFEEDAQELINRVFSNDSSLPKKGDVDLIAGGPPCQGFSGYNRHRNLHDPRNSLVEVFLDFVDYFRPRYVLMENVPGMLSMDEGRVVKALLESFNTIGYQSQLGVLQAGYYGLPKIAGGYLYLLRWKAKNSKISRADS